jgi:hypothetical protein
VGGGAIDNQGQLAVDHSVLAFNSPDNCHPAGTIQGCRN